MDQVKVIIRPGAWSPQVAASLCVAVPYIAVEELEAQVEAGAQLFEVIEAGAPEPFGFFVLRVDGREGVVVAGSGMLRGVDLTLQLLPEIERQFVGCDAVRIHTARPGLVRKLAAVGYGAAEMVLRKRLNG